MSYEPFKCPDCSVWWRGETHKCAGSSKLAKDIESSRKGWISCPMCGKNVTKYDWHSCNNRPHKKDPHDPGHPPIRYS